MIGSDEEGQWNIQPYLISDEQMRSNTRQFNIDN
jgi:hypothetical protein